MNLIEEKSFTILVCPKSVQHGSRARIVGRGTRFAKIAYFTDESKSNYQNSIIVECKHQMPEKPWDGPISLGLRFYFERPKYLLGFKPNEPIPHPVECDLDNIIKGTNDALSKAGLWVNDSRIWKYDYVEKYFCEETLFPRIELQAKLYEDVICKKKRVKPAGRSGV